MTVQSGIDRELPFLRAEAEARMVDTVTIWRATGELTQDEVTGIESPTWEKIYESLPWRLSGTAANSAPYRTLTPGGQPVEQAARVGNMPALFLHDGEDQPRRLDLNDGDLAEITAGENAGTVWRLIETAWQDQSTARRVPTVQVQRPSEWGDPA